MQLNIRSRRGNVIIAIIGALYAVAATVELAMLFLQTRGATGFSDLALQLVLVAVIVVSVYLAAGAVRALGWKRSVSTGTLGHRALS